MVLNKNLNYLKDSICTDYGWVLGGEFFKFGIDSA